MKKMPNVLLVLFSFFLFLSCSKSDSDSNTTLTGNWRVSYFFDSGKDETSDYTGYNFQFNTDATMTATRNAVTTHGTWSIISDDNHKKFVIVLSTTDKDLLELNDDWLLLSQTSNEIKLQDDNPSSNEQLTFTKQ